MAKNSKVKAAVAAKGFSKAQIVRIVLGVLLALNLVGAWMVLYPPGGSEETLNEELVGLQSRVLKTKSQLDEARKHALAIEKGRGSAEEFLNRYFVTRRAVPTTLLTELDEIARRAGIKDRGNNFGAELIEGSETLGMVIITANFEGTYRNLLNFVREIDRSPSLLIIESLNAAPQQGSNMLNVTVKMEAFIREDGPLQVAQEPMAQEVGQ